MRKQWKSPRQHTLHMPTSTQLEDWLAKEWQKQFTKVARRRKHPVWKPHHKTLGKELRAGLNRSEASIVTQLRTGNIGLREYLAARKVPGITPECSCGFSKETIPHFLLFCTKRQGRAAMMLQTNTHNLEILLSEKQPI